LEVQVSLETKEKSVGLKRTLARHTPFFIASDVIYRRSYFEHLDTEQRALFRRLADAIRDRWSPNSVVDVGCGTGLILARLAECGVAIKGIEGSRSAISISPVRNEIIRWNLVRLVPNLGPFDIAVCTEVAEHLPASAAPTLVASLVSLSDVVVFTAATPGQGGRHHLNEQPRAYWESLFAEHGFRRSPPDETYFTERTRDIHEASYIRHNLMVFVRT
jgi:SAM-dependent methyltransferase